MRGGASLVSRKHHELRVWQRSIDLVKSVYRLTSSFPSAENFGLTAQMRRCAISVPSNIAEGAARNSKKEFLHFLGIARGSLSELETQFIIAEELGYVRTEGSLSAILDETFGLLSGLINSLKKVTNE